MSAKDNKDMLAFAVNCVMMFLWHELLDLKVVETKGKFIPDYEDLEKILTPEVVGNYTTIHTNCMEFVDAYHDNGDDIDHWVKEIKTSILKEIEDTPTAVMLLKMINNEE